MEPPRPRPTRTDYRVLPVRVRPEDRVESQPGKPTPEPDQTADAEVRWLLRYA